MLYILMRGSWQISEEYVVISASSYAPAIFGAHTTKIMSQLLVSVLPIHVHFTDLLELLVC